MGKKSHIHHLVYSETCFGRPICHDRLSVLKDHILLVEGSTFQCTSHQTAHARNCIFMANGEYFKWNPLYNRLNTSSHTWLSLHINRLLYKYSINGARICLPIKQNIVSNLHLPYHFYFSGACKIYKLSDQQRALTKYYQRKIKSIVFTPTCYGVHAFPTARR